MNHLIPGHLAADAKPNAVYRYYDHLGRLIYIGITARGIQRQHEHSSLSDWFHYAATQNIEACHDRDASLTLERELIKAFRPPFNKVHNEGWEAVRAAYLAVVAAEKRLVAAQAGRTVVFVERCGHCSGCQESAKPEHERDAWSYAECRLLRPLEEDEEATICHICKRVDCHYEDGLQDGMAYGYEDGHYQGRAKVVREHRGLFVTENFLVTGVIDRSVTVGGGPFILEPPDVDEGPLRIKGVNSR